jgi:outer membrane protein assembly factor BamB
MKKMTHFKTLALIMILSIPLYASLQLSTIQGVSSDENWPMFQHDPAHTGQSSTVLSSNLKSKWNYSQLTGQYIQGVAVDNEYLYFTVQEPQANMIYALNTTTGELIWSNSSAVKNDGSIKSPTVVPTVAEGIVYTASDAYNATTGQLLFNYSSYGGSTSPVYSNGKIYLGSNYKMMTSPSGIIALNAKTGSKIWNFTTKKSFYLFGGMLYFPPAVADGVVYFFSVDGAYALNAKTGIQIWHNSAISNEHGSFSLVSVANGQVYINVLGLLYCLKASSGSVLWTFATGAGDVCPAVADGYVYAGPYALNASTGKMVWNNSLMWTLSSPAVSNGIVYYTNCNRTGTVKSPYTLELLGYNASSGEKILQYQLPGEYLSEGSTAPAIAEGKLYIASKWPSALRREAIFAFEESDLTRSLPVDYGSIVLAIIIGSLAVAVILTTTVIIFKDKQSRNPH